MAEQVTDYELVQDCRKQIDEWYAWFGDNIEQGQSDRRFLFGAQWTSLEEAENRMLGKAQLVYNKIYDFYRKALAEQRKNTVSLKLRATDNATQLDQDTIDLHTSLLRSIAYNSKTEAVYQTAFQTQLHSSFGVIRVKTDWEHEKSFNQIILLEALENPEKAFFDPAAKLPDKSDGDYCGVAVNYSKEYFKRLYPNIDVEKVKPISTGMNLNETPDPNIVTVTEYYYKEYYDEMIYQTQSGEVLTRRELNQLQKMLEEARAMGADPYEIMEFEARIDIVQSRKSKNWKIKRCVVTDKEILEKSEWPSKYFPLVFVDGDSYWDKEKQYTQSFVRHVRDAQRFLNYCAVEIATALKNSRKETFLVTPAQITGFEKIWKNAQKQQGALPFNPDQKVQGGAPIKLPPNELSQSLLHQYQRAEMDIQSIMGVYEAAVGAESNEKSGIAIANRAKQSQNSMFIFFDNLNRAVEQVGRVVLDLMPKIYDTERPVSVTDERGNTHDVIVNQYDPMTDEYYNQVRDYRWDIEIEVGASFEIQKQEAIQTLVSIGQLTPEVMPMVLDLIAENLDLENTPQVVERLKNLVPPEILAKEKGEPPPPKQPSPQEQLMQMQMQVEQGKLKLEEEKIQVEEGKLQTQQLKNQVDMVKAMADLYEIPQEVEVAKIRASAELQKSEDELQRDMIKAYVDTTKAISAMQKATGAKPRESMQ